MNKSTFSIFTKNIGLNIITIFSFSMFILFCTHGLEVILKKGILYTVKEDLVYIILLFLHSISIIWLLNATFLPIIKINEKGIFAYSLFRKRTLFWQEITSNKLILCKTSTSQYGFMNTLWEITKNPINISPIRNNGVRITTYIVVSKENIKAPFNTSCYGLINQTRVAGKKAIAFRYTPKLWNLINDTLTLY